MRRRMGDEMVMVGKDCPGFKLPTEIGCEFEEAALEDIEAAVSVKKVALSIGAGGDKIGAAYAESVNRCVGPTGALRRGGHGDFFSGGIGRRQMGNGTEGEAAGE